MIAPVCVPVGARICEPGAKDNRPRTWLIVISALTFPKMFDIIVIVEVLAPVEMSVTRPCDSVR